MSVFVSAFNEITSHIRAGMVAGQPLADMKELYVAPKTTPSFNNLPYIWVHPDEPPIEEDWSAAKKIREAEHRILIKMAVNCLDPSLYKDTPYGTAGVGAVKGAYSYLEALLNYMDTLTFSSAASVVRYNATVLSMGAIDQTGDTYGVVVRITLTQRYNATGR